MTTGIRREAVATGTGHWAVGWPRCFGTVCRVRTSMTPVNPERPLQGHAASPTPFALVHPTSATGNTVDW